ncbi:HAD-IIA family hydrolase [Eubacteriales bacterium OttesenSCG-928-G02]|nr:HAD-IIA family hydrolase [Eubacteriales bacterium OttesenSCG-928-G02]
METVLNKKSLFILDMDGTIYLDDYPIEGAKEFISLVKKLNKKILYFTNNASKSISMYYEKLNRLGFSVNDGEVISSADVTIDYLITNHPESSVYLVGTPALEKSFTDKGINLVNHRNADIVVSSFDTTLTYEKLEIACDCIRNGAIFYSTHPDFNCPTATHTGFIPDSGAICALITASTGKLPKYFGKPCKETADYIAKITGLSFDDMAIAGDRIYTDIKLGKDHGITSILVLSGETKIEDINDDNKPDYIYNKLGDILPELLIK